MRYTGGLGIYIKLNTARISYADGVADKRKSYNRALGRTNQIDYGPGRVSNNDFLDEDRNGCRGEYVGKLYLDPIEWHAFKEGPVDALPDLGTFIDVKTIRLDCHELLVKVRNVQPEWAYLLVSSQWHPYYWIAGWVWGHEAIIGGVIKHNRPPCYTFPAKMLHPPHLLKQMLHPTKH